MFFLWLLSIKGKENVNQPCQRQVKVEFKSCLVDECLLNWNFVEKKRKISIFVIHGMGKADVQQWTSDNDDEDRSK